MQAVVLSKIGGLKYLHIRKLSKPKPANNEVLIEVEYCGLNHLDLLIIEGKRPGPKTFPHILGSEFVGKIVQNNSNRNNFKIGDRVAVYPWTFCGKCEQCRIGNENICDNGGTFGRTRWGGFAEFVTVPIINLVKIPDNLSMEIVTASTLSTITAYHMIKRVNIKDESIVLINGASGGIGTVAIQLLKAKKCFVICSTSHPEKIDKLKELGFNVSVSSQNIVEDVKKLWPNGVNYVIDAMGGSVWSKSIEVLGKNGSIVFCATTLDEQGTINIGSAFSRQLNILGSYGGTKKDLQDVLSLLQNGAIKPAIDSVYPLEKTKEALSKLSQQKAFGKILIGLYVC